MRHSEAIAVLEDRAKRDVANELAAENERLKHEERIVTERTEWISLSADLLSAAQGILNAWEHSKDAPSTQSAMAEIRAAISPLYGAVMDFDRKARAAERQATLAQTLETERS